MADPLGLRIRRLEAGQGYVRPYQKARDELEASTASFEMKCEHEIFRALARKTYGEVVSLLIYIPDLYINKE